MTAGPCRQSFPFFADRHFLRCVEFDDLGQHVGIRNADASFPVMIGRRNHDPCDSLGQAIPFHEFDAAAFFRHQVVETFLDGSRKRVGAARSYFQATEIHRLENLVSNQAIVESGNPGYGCRAFFLDKLGNEIGCELGETRILLPPLMNMALQPMPRP